MIYFTEFKKHLKSMIIFSSILAVVLIFFIFNTKNNVPALDDAFKSLPKAIQFILGYSAFDETTLIGNFLNIYSYALLAIIIYMLILSTTISYKGNKLSIIDISPISSYKALAYKFLAIITNCLIVLISTLFASSIFLLIAGEKNIYYLFYILYNAIPMIILIGTIGILIGRIPLNYNYLLVIIIVLSIGIYLIYYVTLDKNNLIYNFFILRGTINLGIISHKLNSLNALFSILMAIILFTTNLLFTKKSN